jgi:hypothetical protein
VCLGCPNTIVGANYEGATASGSPFPVLVWQDCCAACKLNNDCVAWVHYTPPTGAQQCYLRTSITRLNPTDPAGNRTITGVFSGWPPPPRYVTIFVDAAAAGSGDTCQLHISCHLCHQMHMQTHVRSAARGHVQDPMVVQYEGFCNTNGCAIRMPSPTYLPVHLTLTYFIRLSYLTHPTGR